MPRTWCADRQRELTAELVQAIAFPQGELFRIEMEKLTGETTGAFLRACLMVRHGQRITLNVRISVFEEDEDDPER